MTGSAQASVVVPATPDAVFGALTDIAALPEWNRAMTAVIEQPDRLEAGAAWVVEFHALGQTWRSRSVVEEIDAARRRFTYRSGTDDGNPSYARWTWTVADEGAGSRVTVAWELRPVTFWRRVLLARVRARQLARTEVPRSLEALATAATSRERAQVRPAEG